MNTVSFLAIPAGIVPDQEAIVSGADRFTYAETFARVRRLAGALEKLGVGRGTRVAALHTTRIATSRRTTRRRCSAACSCPSTIAPSGPSWSTCCARARRRSSSSASATGEVESLRDSLPNLKTLVGFDEGRGAMPSYESLLAGAAEREDEAEVDDDDTSILMFTSGTTSLPKGVMLRFGDFSAYVTANVELADGTPRGAALLCAAALPHRRCHQHDDHAVDGAEARDAAAVRAALVARPGGAGAHLARVRRADDDEAHPRPARPPDRTCRAWRCSRTAAPRCRSR
jgi:acyl-CoA synthetase (AMP-forming)/AMP-acid ligase II